MGRSSVGEDYSWGLINSRYPLSYAELPLEPSLSRTLLEANECGCLSQALTVAAMLSAETTLLLGQRYVDFYKACTYMWVIWML